MFNFFKEIQGWNTLACDSHKDEGTARNTYEEKQALKKGISFPHLPYSD